MCCNKPFRRRRRRSDGTMARLVVCERFMRNARQIVIGSSICQVHHRSALLAPPVRTAHINICLCDRAPSSRASVCIWVQGIMMLARKVTLQNAALFAAAAGAWTLSSNSGESTTGLIGCGHSMCVCVCLCDFLCFSIGQALTGVRVHNWCECLRVRASITGHLWSWIWHLISQSGLIDKLNGRLSNANTGSTFNLCLVLKTVVVRMCITGG